MYGVATTKNITQYGPTPSIDINIGTRQRESLSPSIFNIFLEPLLRWLTMGSRGYHPGSHKTNADPNEPTVT
jgi:hypothetical protein